MKVAVLVHGGFHGGWCWDRVRPGLEEDGWTVYTPSLTGLGDRAYLSSPSITLRTHVEDVVDLIETENLTAVTLCGHSAAGMVITGVADAVPKRIDTVVYLDAPIPKDGESMFDIYGQASLRTATLKRQASEHGEGWLIPASCYSASDFGVSDPADAEWVEQHLTDHPIAAFADRLVLTNGPDRVVNKVFVRCAMREVPQLDMMLESVNGSPGWTVHRWPSAHDVMVTEPERVVALFSSIGIRQMRQPTS